MKNLSIAFFIALHASFLASGIIKHDASLILPVFAPLFIIAIVLLELVDWIERCNFKP